MAYDEAEASLPMPSDAPAEKASSPWRARLKRHLAPAAVGALLGVLATLALAVPLALLLRRNLDAESRRLSALTVDTARYTETVRRFYPLLSEAELRGLFPEGDRTVFVASHPMGPDGWQSEQLKESPEGAYVLHCTGRLDSRRPGDFCAALLTREEAIKWAQLHVTFEELQKEFSLQELAEVVGQRVFADVCHQGRAP
jgi:hypothetical protein